MASVVSTLSEQKEEAEKQLVALHSEEKNSSKSARPDDRNLVRKMFFLCADLATLLDGPPKPEASWISRSGITRIQTLSSPVVFYR